MQFAMYIKLILLNALVIGTLLGMPLQANAADGGDGVIVNHVIVDAGESDVSVAGDVDALVNEESSDEEDNAAANSGVGSPEYKYVPVRRY